MLYAYTTKYYTAIKKNKIMWFAGKFHHVKWNKTDLEGKSHMCSVICCVSGTVWGNEVEGPEGKSVGVTI
jgi:hypothetical protein